MNPFGWVHRYFRLDIYARMFPYIKPYKWTAIAASGLSFLRSFFNLASPWPLAILIDYGLSRKPLPPWLDALPGLSTGRVVPVILFAILAGLALNLFRDAFDVFLAYLRARVNRSMTLRYRCDVFSHLQRLSFRYHDRNPVADSLYRIQEDTSNLADLVWGNYQNLLNSVIQFVTMLLILLHLDWRIALLAMATLPISLGVTARESNRFRFRSKAIKAIEAKAQAIAQEALTNLRVVKAFGQELREETRYEETQADAMNKKLRLNVRQNLLQLFLDLIANVTRAGILLFGALEVYHGHIYIGELTVIMSYVSGMQGPIGTLGYTVGNMQMAMASGERVVEVLDQVPDVTEAPQAYRLPQVTGHVAFERVNFAYTPGEPVLHDIEFSAEPGSVIAIVGPTGSGKSTLASLTVRFYDPDSGRVTLDGRDLRDLSVQTLRDNIALVIQEPSLFSASVAECIAYGRPDATEDEIVAAAEAASAHEFISRLPEGYDTLVGQRGMRLSGGERQRIAIARAFVKDAPILILDEPTSSLDAKTEASLLDALDRLMVGRTTFIIAHRLSTLRQATNILVLDHGTIVEEGAPRELLDRGGRYAELYRLQSRVAGVEAEATEPLRAVSERS